MIRKLYEIRVNFYGIEVITHDAWEREKTYIVSGKRVHKGILNKVNRRCVFSLDLKEGLMSLKRDYERRIKLYEDWVRDLKREYKMVLEVEHESDQNV